MGESYVLDRDEDGLTAREREAFDLVLKHKTASASTIGRHMGISKQRASQIVHQLIVKGLVHVEDGVLWVPVDRANH